MSKATDDGNAELLCEGNGYLRRARSQQLQKVFEKYASKDTVGEKLMTPEDFFINYLGLFESDSYDTHSIQFLARAILNTGKDGFISYSEFRAFEGLLCFPDAVYKIAFMLFDTDDNGLVSFQDFAEVMTQIELHKRIPINLHLPFVKLYFGKDESRLISYKEFGQFLRDFHDEYTIECFRRTDIEGTGFISVSNFRDIMIETKSNLLTKQIQSHLLEIVQISSETETGTKISFPYFMAFNALLTNMELVKRIYSKITKGHRTKEVTKDEFMHAAQVMSQITPLQIDILFKVCEVLSQNSRIVYKDLNIIAPEQYWKQITTNRLIDLCAVSSPEDRGVLIQILENTYRFTLGSIAGVVGATAVYPIDLVKTRMQNQRTGALVTNELMYRNSFDCFRKVVRHEGVLGLYGGLLAQVLGVAPEKALKLTVHDFVRDKFCDKSGHVPLWGETVSGACAGASQLIFTNPLEIVKIRLQLAGKSGGGTKVGAWSVVKELGLFGLYTGARACILRDVIFNGIYFTTYAFTKARLADERGYNQPFSLFIAGATASIPAASISTPTDLIKTRLQAVTSVGHTTYDGIFDAARKIYAEEGFKAFWKGTVARVCRSSPQFGVTLLTYELLQRMLFVDFGGTRPPGSEVKVSVLDGQKPMNPDHIGGYSAAIPIFLGIEKKFGICLPKFSIQKP